MTDATAVRHEVHRIGFIGLGAMGWPMASRLAQSGFQLAVMDIDKGRMESFAREHRAEKAATPAQIGGNDVIITMLPTSRHVASVLQGDDGLLRHVREGTIIVDMTSGAPTTTWQIGEAVAAAGCRMIDAPVSGGVARACTGELAIMVGGDASDIDRVRVLLSTMGSSILETGALGSAHAMKALNNLVSATTFLATVEALSIGKRFGLDPARMVDILNVSTGMSNSSQKKMHQFVLTGNYSSGFGLDLMVKDLTIALGIAHETGVTAPLSAVCREIWQGGASALGPGQDHTALAKAVENITRVGLVGD